MLRELAPGVTVNDVAAATEPTLHVPVEPMVMEYSLRLTRSSRAESKGTKDEGVIPRRMNPVHQHTFCYGGILRMNF